MGKWMWKIITLYHTNVEVDMIVIFIVPAELCKNVFIYHHVTLPTSVL